MDTLPATSSRNKLRRRSCSREVSDLLDFWAEETDRFIDGLPALLEEKQLTHDAGRQAERGIKAMMLSPTLDVCRALLRGERVPWNVLHYFQAERYGLRRRQPDGRYDLDDFNDVRRPA